ncbi:MAG: phosphatidate cytidylyltransferase [Planctomycetota bacterium]
MLKHRLFFGTVMVLLFVGLVVVDAWLDGSVTSTAGKVTAQGTILCLLIAILTIPGQLELAGLIERTGAKIFRPVVITASILLATSWYWRQFFPAPLEFHFYYMLFVLAFSLLAVMLYQGLRFATTGAITNLGANFFAVFYLGFLSGFVLGMRIDFSIWCLFMFVFTVKSSDIGAYTIGSLFGRHKFSPKISPGKTWEGLAGAIIFASIVAVMFSHFCGIMSWPYAVVFGVVFAVSGQLGDLAESMIKRDAEQKDSARTVPGFGGILDIIDSPLATAPMAYLFFMLTVTS